MGCGGGGRDGEEVGDLEEGVMVLSKLGKVGRVQTTCGWSLPLYFWMVCEL